ncbi:MAG: nuclear transport factor 2 family protein [Proteobacteria bacterium]|nr:nuclear transport factor 2 family protein [Pseudomonadota bacterium]
MDDPNLRMLSAYADAWNDHDIDRIMSFMTPDCIFQAGGGPESYGSRHQGSVSVRERFLEVWAFFPDARWSEARHFVNGDRGMSEWLFTGTDPDGTMVEIHGCDVFTFRDGMIAIKDTFLKART